MRVEACYFCGGKHHIPLFVLNNNHYQYCQTDPCRSLRSSLSRTRNGKLATTTISSFIQSSTNRVILACDIRLTRNSNSLRSK